MRGFLDRLFENFSNRFFTLLCLIILLFLGLTVRLFNIQIIHGEQYEQELTASILHTVDLPASRGSIYDRYGRPLAVNKVAFSVKIDDSVKIDIEDVRNDELMALVRYFDKKGTPLLDTLPISQQEPYRFTFGQDEAAAEAEEAWKTKIGLDKKQMDMNAGEVLAYLYKKFEVPSDMSVQGKRGMVSLGVDSSDKNLMYISLVKILEENGEKIVSDFPISLTQPYTFLFNGNTAKEQSWKDSVEMKKEKLQYSAEQTMEYLSGFFGISKSLPEAFRSTVISLKHSIYTERWRKYEPVTAAQAVSDKTVASIEEKQDMFTGVLIDTDSLREYPQGEYFSHMLGYIRKMSAEEFSEYKEYKNPDGTSVYSNNDIVGKSGIEKQQELNLNGVDGKMYVEVDSSGRRINTIETQEPISGKNVFLTLDQKLQKFTYDTLEATLRDILIRKLSGGSASYVKTMFVSMVKSNNISVDKICKATEGEQKAIKDLILANNPELTFDTKEDIELAKTIINNAIESGVIPFRQLVLVLYEQGKFQDDPAYVEQIRAGTVYPVGVVINKLRSGELRPYETALKPCTGSITVQKVGTGEILALVTYPSYDNNRLVNNFDNEYYNMLSGDQETSPFVNRPLMEKKAPGSTFKMIPAIAGLESGVITPSSTIQDLGEFTKSGKPYAKCWIASSGGRHGSVNVAKALEVSCNYFFYELAYRMGNYTDGMTEKSITTLNEYMAAFGLNEKTGIEIGETTPMMASPKSKEESAKWLNPDATTSQTRWKDGDNIRAFIGQSVNSFTTAQMTRYIATLANGGTLYKSHIIEKVENSDNTLYEKTEEVVENILEIAPANLEVVLRGMYNVTSGGSGTLRGVFSGFPIEVGAKSGTAQEKLDESSHTWFVGIAPYDDPQIAITVMIAFGEEPGAPGAVVAREVIGEYMGLNYEPQNNYMENILAK